MGRGAALAARIVEHVSAGRAGRMALFGPRRTVKTTLLVREAMPQAAGAGFVAVYADCWHDRSDPIAGLNYALEQAIDAIEVPANDDGAGDESVARPLPARREGGTELSIWRDEVRTAALAVAGGLVAAAVYRRLSPPAPVAPADGPDEGAGEDRGEEGPTAPPI